MPSQNNSLPLDFQEGAKPKVQKKKTWDIANSREEKKKPQEDKINPQ